MPAGSSREPLLVDTSAAVALVLPLHPHHEQVLDALADRPRGLAGHAAFETYSVLTRLPAPDRLDPRAARELLQATFPETRHLSRRVSAQLIATLAEKGLAGGAVYDALVGAAAVEHGLTLATRDHRALDTYRELGADVLLL